MVVLQSIEGFSDVHHTEEVVRGLGAGGRVHLGRSYVCVAVDLQGREGEGREGGREGGREKQREAGRDTVRCGWHMC